MSQRSDDIVIGAGIVGLALAYTLARSGRRVTVLERSPHPQGASVRNFGTLWPIGQPSGPRRAMALRSVDIWKRVLTDARIWFAAAGSLHAAYHEDELQVLSEFASGGRLDAVSFEILTGEQAVLRCAHLRPAGLKGAMWSPSEVQVNPRDALRRLPEWLRTTWDVRFEWQVAVTAASGGVVRAGRRSWACERIWIAPGDELQTLYPEAFADLGLRRCKLQMMRTAPVRWTLGPILAAGLTLGHYESFADCPSLPTVKARLARDWPRQVAYGVHVLVAQHDRLHLVVGDSHEYDGDIEPFDKPTIDGLVLEYLNTFLMHTPVVVEQWHGTYVKHPQLPYCVLTPDENVVALAGLGGHGMTLSFGLAEEVVRLCLR